MIDIYEDKEKFLSSYVFKYRKDTKTEKVLFSYLEEEYDFYSNSKILDKLKEEDIEDVVDEKEENEYKIGVGLGKRNFINSLEGVNDQQEVKKLIQKCCRRAFPEKRIKLSNIDKGTLDGKAEILFPNGNTEVKIYDKEKEVYFINTKLSSNNNENDEKVIPLFIDIMTGNPIIPDDNTTYVPNIQTDQNLIIQKEKLVELFDKTKESLKHDYIAQKEELNKLNEKDTNFNNTILLNKDHDLIKDNAFSGVSVAVLNYIGTNYFYQHIKDKLSEKGVSIVEYINEELFLNELDKSHIAVVISSGQSNDCSRMVEKCTNYYQNGKSLFLFADNDPLYFQANKLLEKIYNSTAVQLQGSDPGRKILKANTNSVVEKGMFNANHLLGRGFISIYEGVTICYPTIVPEDLEVFAVNSSGNPLILCSSSKRNSTYGKLMIDTGFTKLSCGYNQHGPEVVRYISNSIGWLLNTKDDEKYYNI